MIWTIREKGGVGIQAEEEQTQNTRMTGMGRILILKNNLN